MSIPLEEKIPTKKPGKYLSFVKATRIAEILETTMTNAGYYDDWDEITGNMIDNNVPDNVILDYAKSVEVAVDFVHQFTRGLGDNSNNTFYIETVEMLKQK